MTDYDDIRFEEKCPQCTDGYVIDGDRDRVPCPSCDGTGGNGELTVLGERLMSFLHQVVPAIIKGRMGQ